MLSGLAATRPAETTPTGSPRGSPGTAAPSTSSTFDPGRGDGFDVADHLQLLREQGGTDEQLAESVRGLVGRAQAHEPVAYTGGTPQLAALLDDTAAAIRRFVVLPAEAHAVVLALWVAHTHAFEAADCTPYIQVTSAEKRCGKTRLLEVLNHLVAKPWKTGRVTPAVLTRKISKERPTLLLDEFDAALKSGDEYTQTVRGILNAGYERDGKTSVCVVRGKTIGYEDLNVFCPKCLAGIGEMPDTIADRSIRIELRRRKPDGEPVERFRRRTHKEELASIRDGFAAWADAGTVIEDLADAEPDLPSELDDHAQDVWEPLLAIADLAGEAWADQARRAAVELSGARQTEDDSEGIRLLAGTKAAFDNQEGSRIPTRDLAVFLAGYDEAAFGDYCHDGETARGASKKIAKGLRRFGITSTTVRVASGGSDQTTPRKGYKREDFEDAWAALPPPSPVTAVTSRQPCRFGRCFPAVTQPPCNGIRTGREPA